MVCPTPDVARRPPGALRTERRPCGWPAPTASAGGACGPGPGAGTPGGCTTGPAAGGTTGGCMAGGGAGGTQYSYGAGERGNKILVTRGLGGSSSRSRGDQVMCMEARRRQGIRMGPTPGLGWRIQRGSRRTGHSDFVASRDAQAIQRISQRATQRPTACPGPSA